MARPPILKSYLVFLGVTQQATGFTQEDATYNFSNWVESGMPLEWDEENQRYLTVADRFLGFSAWKNMGGSSKGITKALLDLVRDGQLVRRYEYKTLNKPGYPVQPIGEYRYFLPQFAP